MNTTLSTNDVALANGVAGGVIGASLVIAITCVIVFYLLQVIAGWKIFEKAGEKGWKALIPIYSTYIFFKIVGMKNYFWGLLALSFVAGFVATLTGFNTENLNDNSYTGGNLVGALVYLGTGIVAFVIEIIYAIRTSKAFGHGAGYAVGLVLLQPIFLLILGFGSSKYNKKTVASWRKK